PRRRGRSRSDMAAGGSAFAAAVAARVEGFQAELEATVASWRRERQARADQLRVRLGELSAQLGMALGECRRRVGARPTRSRQQALAALRFVAVWDRERERIEDSVWALLHASRVEEKRWREQALARAAELDALARRIALEADTALTSALGGASGP